MCLGAPQDQKSTNRASSCNLARETCQAIETRNVWVRLSVFGCAWGVFGCAWGVFGCVRGAFGCVCGGLGVSKACLGVSGARLGLSGACLGVSGARVGVSVAVWVCLRRVLILLKCLDGIVKRRHSHV